MDKIKISAIRDFCSKNVVFLLFWCFFVLYLILGIVLNCQTDTAIKGGWDVIYALDTRSRLFDFTEPFVKGFAYPEVHPFQLILIPTLVFPFKILGLSNIFSVIIVQSLLGGISVPFIYKILGIFSEKKVNNLLLSLVYGLSFSMLIFASSPENYIFIAFFSSVNLYYVLKCKELEKLSWVNIFVLAFLSFSMFSINLICIAYSIVLIVYLLFSIYRQQFKKIIIAFFKFVIVFLSFVVLFSICHKNLYPHLDSFQDLFLKKDVVESKIDRHSNLFATKKFNKNTKVNVLEGVFVKPFYSLKSEVRVDKNNLLGSNLNFAFEQDKKIYYPIAFFCGLALLSFVVNIILHYASKFIEHSFLLPFKEKIRHLDILFICLFLVVMHILFSTLYASWECFLYSLNAFLYFIILLGVLFFQCNKKIFIAVSLLFILFQIIMNFYNLAFLREYLYINSSPNYCFDMPMVVICIFIFFIFLLSLFFREKLQKVVERYSTDRKYLICTVTYIMLIIIYVVFEFIFKV